MGKNDAVKRQGKLYGKRTGTSPNVVKYETYRWRSHVKVVILQIGHFL